MSDMSEALGFVADAELQSQRRRRAQRGQIVPRCPWVLPRLSREERARRVAEFARRAEREQPLFVARRIHG